MSRLLQGHQDHVGGQPEYAKLVQNAFGWEFVWFLGVISDDDEITEPLLYLRCEEDGSIHGDTVFAPTGGEIDEERSAVDAGLLDPSRQRRIGTDRLGESGVC